MEIKEYYRKINAQSQQILEQSLDISFLGKINDFTSALELWRNSISLIDQKELINKSIEQIELSSVMLLNGFYRSAFIHLRLSLEILYGSIFFSTNLMDFREWKLGKKDNQWNAIIDVDNGILSKRFASVFFPELKDTVMEYYTDSKILYRELSEYVHGNYSTWEIHSPTLSYNDELIQKYDEFLKKYTATAHFILCLRYLKEINKLDLEALEHEVMDILGHVAEIRVFFGGQR